MFVRLAFAVAINIDPEILIVDEALSVGDVFFQAKCYHKFEEFKEQGKTILFVSHDLSSISKYCDRVILLNKGRMLDEGAPKAMVDMYKQLLVHQDPVKQTEGAEDAPGTQENWREGFRVNPDTLEYGEKQGWTPAINKAKANGHKVAVIGSGPAGMSAAYSLALGGYDVTHTGEVRIVE